MIEQLENFLSTQTTVIANHQQQEAVRCEVMLLYRHYIAHCQQYKLDMADKDTFAIVAKDSFGMQPEQRISRRGYRHLYYEGVKFLGKYNFLIMTPEVKALLDAPSILEGTKRI